MVFVLVGPPIGGVVFWIEALALALWEGRAVMPGAVRLEDIRFLFVATLLSYLYGGPFAVASGVLHAAAAIWLRQNSIMVPITAAVVVSAAGGALLVLSAARGALMVLMGGLTIILPASLVASLVCWYLTRQWLRAA
jgi:hypothetical protein